jgi:hypothetical protein
MALRFVLDEHLRGPLWRAVQRHNARDEDPIDVVRVGDPPDLLLATDDRALLAWAEGQGRILVTCDKHTIPAHLAAHLAGGNRSPGVFMAEQFRIGALKNWVFKEPGAYRTLRELGRTHAMVMQDVVRVQNRIKALYRSRGIAVAGRSVYSEKSRKQYLDKLPDASRGAADDRCHAFLASRQRTRG